MCPMRHEGVYHATAENSSPARENNDTTAKIEARVYHVYLLIPEWPSFHDIAHEKYTREDQTQEYTLMPCIGTSQRTGEKECSYRRSGPRHITIVITLD